MATFLNKKEQVYDLKLTSYGRYLLSIGTFKPVYYAFFDNNVVYDIKYTSTGSSAGTHKLPIEGQNKVNERVKRETVYPESQVLFRDVESTLSNLETTDGGFDSDLNPTLTTPAADIYTYDSALGDAMLDADNSQAVPSWRLLMLQGAVSSSIYRQGAALQPAYAGEPRDGILLHSPIPQINISASYSLKVMDPEIIIDPLSVRNLIQTSEVFADNKVIGLVSKDPLIYFEEVNTQLLTENFDIEVFEVESGSNQGTYSPTLHRKYFETVIPQIENGVMLTETPHHTVNADLTTSSVEYYFDVLQDANVDQTIACGGIESFDKSSYFISFDFDCPDEGNGITFYDIYGSVTEPEICQD